MDLGESANYLRHYLRHYVTLAAATPLIADDAIARLHRVGQRAAQGPEQRSRRRLDRRRVRGQGTLVDDACAKKAVAELTRD